MGFETWLDKRRRQPGIISQQEIWDAATTEANRMLGDQSNEAEKDARRKVAVGKLLAHDTYKGTSIDIRQRVDAIIKIAQG